MTLRTALCGAVLLALMTGCGNGRVTVYPVKGRVQFADGTPVRSGTIEFESTQGTTATGRIENDGTFVLGTYTRNDGAAAGPQRVIVVQMIISDGLTRHATNHGRRVDPRFGSYDRSGLTANVEAKDANSITITLPPVGS